MPGAVLPFRQIHLDFHTSPEITDVAADFDARAFAHSETSRYNLVGTTLVDTTSSFLNVLVEGLLGSPPP